jgi:hypothetical protein
MGLHEKKLAEIYGTLPGKVSKTTNFKICGQFHIFRDISLHGDLKQKSCLTGWFPHRQTRQDGYRRFCLRS